MSVTRSIGKEIIQLNDECLLEIEEKEDDGYKWKNLTIKSDNKETLIGSYFTYNYSSSREWMRYNSKYIVIIASYNLGYDYTDPSVKILFDIENNQFIEGTDRELMDIYLESFKGISRKRTR